MTTPAQARRKKKNKESTKVSLEESDPFDSTHGRNVASSKTAGTRLDRVNHDQQVIDTQQARVPIVPRAQRGPGIDFESLPDEGPYRVSLFNLPMSVEEKEISERILSGLKIIRLESTKNSWTVELGNKNDLYEALCKDGASIKGRTVNVLLQGHEPQNNHGSDRHGSRGGNSSFGDRYGDRDRGFGGQRGGSGRYGDRPGGFSRDRDSSYGGFNRAGPGAGGYTPQRCGGGGGGYNDRSADRPMEQYSDRPNERYDRPIEEKNQNPSAASSYYAGAKCLSPPVPSLLPMPPKSWLKTNDSAYHL